MVRAIAGARCPTCSDGAQNGDEAGRDCGGSCGKPCTPCTRANQALCNPSLFLARSATASPNATCAPEYVRTPYLPAPSPPLQSLADTPPHTCSLPTPRAPPCSLAC